TPFVQRRLVHNEGSEDKERPVQAKFFSETSREPLQRQPDTEEDETAGALTESFEAGADVETQVSQRQGRGRPVPDGVRTYMEPRFGVDFSQVRVHTGSDAIHMNRDVGAQAFTHGSDIYFGEGHCPSNLELTAHELTHVVQQTGGAALTQGYRKYKATFQASPPFGASHHPASDHPAPRGATPQASPEHQLGSLAGSQQAAIRRPEYSSRLPDDGGRQVLVLQRAAGNVAAGRAWPACPGGPAGGGGAPRDRPGVAGPGGGPARGRGRPPRRGPPQARLRAHDAREGQAAREGRRGGAAQAARRLADPRPDRAAQRRARQPRAPRDDGRGRGAEGLVRGRRQGLPGAPPRALGAAPAARA